MWKKLLSVLLLVIFSQLQAIAASVLLQWNASTDNVGVAGYNIYRNGVKIGSSATTSYTDTGLDPSTQYAYTVTAFDAAGNESGQSAITNVTTLASSSGPEFIPLHKYYISPTGSDSANGLSPSTAWATANHPVVCGDLIIAAAGNYNTSQFGDVGGGSFGAVSNCPSSSGGIDGSGGIYFAILLCAGPDLMSCKVNGGSGPAFEVDKSNWAIEGFWATMNTNGDRGCFSALGATSGTMWHHVAWINNIASTCDLAGFGTGNVGIGNAGLDQTAIVGGIVFDGANSLGPFGVCGSGISTIPAPQNTDAGTHIFLSQNFVYKSSNASGGTECQPSGPPPQSHTDGEGIIFDTWGGNSPPYAQQGVVKNNVAWANGNACFEAFPQGDGTTNDKAQIYVKNNTCWGNNLDPNARCGGELYLNGIYPTISSGGIYSVTNNIFFATVTSCGGAGFYGVIGAQLTGHASHVTPLTNPPITVSGNYIWSSVVPTHPNVNGGAGFNTYVVNNTSTGCTPPGGPPCFDAPWIFGTNTLQDPGLTNPAGLPTSAPDCTGYTSTVNCMLTKYNVYNLIKPTIASTTFGYQPPSSCVVSDSDFPSWLKGIVYLRVVGNQIFEYSDLITKPCGL